MRKQLNLFGFGKFGQLFGNVAACFEIDLNRIWSDLWFAIQDALQFLVIQVAYAQRLDHFLVKVIKQAGAIDESTQTGHNILRVVRLDRNCQLVDGFNLQRLHQQLDHLAHQLIRFGLVWVEEHFHRKFQLVGLIDFWLWKFAIFDHIHLCIVSFDHFQWLGAVVANLSNAFKDLQEGETGKSKQNKKQTL